MINIKEYCISEQVKVQLGIIIRETRIKYFNEFKKENLIENNPYTKDNFCENSQICHYHTLTKLESSFIKEDNVYHLFLKKLNLFFQLEEEDHQEIINVLNNLVYQLLKVIEYGDYNLEIKIMDHLAVLKFDHDCIASMYLELLIYSYKVFIKKEKNIRLLEKIEKYINVFEGVFKALAFHTISYCYYNLHDIEKAKFYCFKAIEIYKKYDISIGLSYLPLVRIYIKESNYFEAMNLCNELEVYYINTNNKMRLLQIYIYLSSYYLIINSYKFAEKYYDEALYLAADDERLKHLIYSLHFSWGVKKLYAYKYEESIKFFRLAYNSCIDNGNILKIINMLLVNYTKLKCDKEEFVHLINKGKDYLQYSPELEQNIFQYFKYKLDNKSYCRRYTHKKIIPKLKLIKKMKIILLFFYEELYD